MPKTYIDRQLVQEWYVDRVEVQRVYLDGKPEAVVNGDLVYTKEINLVISTNVFDYNMADECRKLGWNGKSALTVKLTVLSGCVAGSTNYSSGGVRTGWFPPGSKVFIYNYGWIVGRGGNGGRAGVGWSGYCAYDATAGYPGGPGLMLDCPTNIANYGIIGGGGGGGAGGNSDHTWGGGGGGGAGAVVGDNGPSGVYSGLAGTLGSGGQGGGTSNSVDGNSVSRWGGAGGSPGHAGDNGWLENGGRSQTGGGGGGLGAPGGGTSGNYGSRPGGVGGPAIQTNGWPITWINRGTLYNAVMTGASGFEVILTDNAYNFNLSDYLSNNFGYGGQICTVDVTVNPGVVIANFVTGLPFGSVVNLRNYGQVWGIGGYGGNGSYSYVSR